MSASVSVGAIDPALRFAAIELMDSYAELIDADRLEDWLDLFAETSAYRVLPRENVEQGMPVPLILCTSKDMLRDRITSLRKANEYNLHTGRHLIGGVRLRRAGDGGLTLNANYAVFQTDLEGHARLFSVGRYADKLVVDGDRLLIADKTVIVDNFAVPTLLAVPL